MPIKPRSGLKALQYKVDEAVRAQHAALLHRVKAIGEECVNAARNLPSPNAADFPDPGHIPPHRPHYMDWSGHLRNSIGYVLLDNGKVENEYFPGSGQGAEDGKSFARRIASGHPSGIVLVVVAGKEYARYVSDKGYDVLDTAHITAERLLRRLMDRLRR